MRRILLLVLSLSVAPLACDFNAGLTSYCARTNACTCTEIGCCLHEGVRCGGPGECCPGSVCSEDGVCVAGQRAVLRLLADPVAFPRLEVGASSGPVIHVVRNEGLSATSLLSSSVVGDPSAFEIGDLCSGSVLEPGAECAIQVTYRPTSAGSHAALLTLTDATEILSVPMSGQAGLPVSILLRGGGSGRVSVGPEQSTCPSACIALVEPGQVRLVAREHGPSEFTGFIHPGCAAGSSVCDLSVSEATQVEASFVGWLRIQIEGSETVVVLRSGWASRHVCQPPGCELPVSGLHQLYVDTLEFQGWSGACSGTASPCNLDITGPTQVTATFSSASVDAGTEGLRPLTDEVLTSD